MSTIMVWFIISLVVLVIGVAVIAASGKLGGMPPQVDDRPGPDLPEGLLNADHIRTARFAMAIRGYSPAQVDQILDRVEIRLATHTDYPNALSGADLRALRFDVVSSGYSMDQVDILLDRVADQLDTEAEKDLKDATVAETPKEPESAVLTEQQQAKTAE